MMQIPNCEIADMYLSESNMQKVRSKFSKVKMK